MSHAQAVRVEQSLRALVPSNPKRPASGHDWFDYYAGYADAFVADVIRALDGRASTLLDPWNGSGTTTAAAAKSGLRAVGLDINPATVVIAKARLLTSDVAPSLEPLAADAIEHAAQRRDVPDHTDLLLNWFMPATAGSIRRIERAVGKLMVSSDQAYRLTEPGALEAVSSLAALFYLALFRTTRELLAPFLTSNPTWIRLRSEPSNRVRASYSTIARRFCANVRLLRTATEANEYPVPHRPSDVRLASSSKIPLRRGSVGAVITSPPYCTRIDYAIATLPELAVMGHDWPFVQSLRARLIGTPTMVEENQGDLDLDTDLGSGSLSRLLTTVATHPSYAARSYYLRFYRQYFRGMHDSLAELHRVTRAGAPVVLVVQDSWFKDIRVATPDILTEMAQTLGWTTLGEHRFDVRTRAAAHPHRADRATSRATESVTVFSR